MPRELSVRVRPSLGLKGREALSWETTVTCPVRSGLWRCAVPAGGKVDLRIQGVATMPVYRWGEGIGEGQTVDLGNLRLRRGATVSGWLRVDDEEGQPGVPEHAVQVRLVPLGLPTVRLKAPISRVTLEVRSQPWGFFRFDSLKPGRYAIVASEPGLAPVRFGPVQIRGDRSIELRDPLRLRRPATLAGRIDPPLPPVQKGLLKTWQVRLEPKPSPIPGEELTAVAGKDGLWGLRDLAAGDYVLSVKDAQGSAWVVREIHLEPGPRKMDLQIPTRTLTGRVSQTGKPLLANLDFTGADATGPFRADTDEDGNFRAVFPESRDLKTWSVRLQAPEILPINLKDPFPSLDPPETVPANVWARPEIRVPDTCLPVVVVDSQRRPVPFALVVVPGTPGNQFRADASGFCEIRGLKGGLQQILAEHPQLLCRSETARVELREGIKAPLLCLALPQQTVIDKNAGQLIADRLVDQHRGDRRIDAAGQAADHPSLPHLGADPSNFRGAETRHGPAA